MIDSARLLLRFAAGLPGYLRTPLTPAACREAIVHRLERREVNFLSTVERAVFGVVDSPYRRLLEHAGIGLDDIREAVGKHGLEGTLEFLYDEGVYVRHDEFKGRTPIRRGSLEIATSSHDFDNPLLSGQIVGQTGGSRSSGTRIYFDLAHFAQDAGYDWAFLFAHGLLAWPYALWRPTPPWGSGIKAALSHAKLGLRTERWFSQRASPWFGRSLPHTLVTGLAVQAGRLARNPIPRPEHVPLQDAWRIAAWLADNVQAGTPALINTNAASGVRICLAALERGLDIGGSRFRFGGEPLTSAKADAVHAAGAACCCHYTMGEVGRISVACAHPSAVDDVHLLTDKFGLIRRPPSRNTRSEIAINIYTTLGGAAPKLMLNVESDDYGVLEARRCGCALDQIGYHLHMHTIRSVEKLTSEGMTFGGVDLLRLVEHELPTRIGGHATDWQLLEEEQASGLPRISLLASPRIGAIDEEAVLSCVYRFLDNVPNASDPYSRRWREANTLRIVRREPLATGASKVLALHSIRPH